MKQATIIIYLLLILFGMFSSAKAQYLEMGVGTDFHNPIAVINAGVEIRKVVIEGTLSPSLTRNLANNYFAMKAGYNINGFIPSIGYYYDHVSSDDKNLNKNLIGYSLKYYKMITELGGLFGNVLYINKGVRISVGVRCEIN